MYLTKTEIDRLVIFSAAELARKRMARKILLNYPEACALLTDEILEGAREGKNVAELIGFGSTILDTGQVLPGVAELMPVLQVEASFSDGTKLVTVHQPIRPGSCGLAAPGPVPGEIFAAEQDVVLNEGRRKHSLMVTNTGDRPVQVGSHFHFFEVNSKLDFDRRAAFGMHLDIPAGTAVRFEPGELREVCLTAYGGSGALHGFNNLTNGNVDDPLIREKAFKLAAEQGFKGI
jgi:urease subunit gamma/beta